MNSNGFIGDCSLSGAHKKDSFESTLAAAGDKYKLAGEPVEIAPGIWKIEYQVQKQLSGNRPVPGEYNAQLYEKTIYDPNVYSDAEMARLGAKAADQAIFPDGKREIDVIVEGRTFRVYKDNAGKITNAAIVG